MPWSRIPEGVVEPDGDRIMTFKQAVREAIDQAMGRDASVFVIGLDADDQFGMYGTLADMSHPDRIIGTPISENAMTGVAMGAALSGMRPIHTHMRVDFMMLAMDQIVNYAAKWRYMFRGQARAPLVIRAVMGRGWGCGAQHSGTLHSLFAHIPGLKVVLPSTPYDVKGLMLAAIKDDYPVIVLEHRWLYNNSGHVPEAMYTLPFGRANVLHEGGEATIVATSLAAFESLEACRAADLDVDLIDPRTIKPLDTKAIIESVRRTGRLFVVDYDFPFAGFAAEVAAVVAETDPGMLKGPVVRITFPECSMPASGKLEKAFYPSAEKIAARLKAELANGRATSGAQPRLSGAA